jgi:hypothetical protein
MIVEVAWIRRDRVSSAWLIRRRRPDAAAEAAAGMAPK